jgi:hypothetical protein
MSFRPANSSFFLVITDLSKILLTDVDVLGVESEVLIIGLGVVGSKN